MSEKIFGKDVETAMKLLRLSGDNYTINTKKKDDGYWETMLKGNKACVEDKDNLKHIYNGKNR